MRYYKIIIEDPNGNPLPPASLKGTPLSSLLPNGQPNLAALQIELDIQIFNQTTPGGNPYLRIWGLGLEDIGGAYNLNPKTTGTAAFNTISIYGGMSPGLPLATAQAPQAGLLVKGSILQAYGNWLGTEQTVDIILAPFTGTQANPLNITLNWKAGTTLASALRTALSQAFPNTPLQINISDRLVQNSDYPHVAPTLSELAQNLNPVTKRIITDAGYAGVDMTYNGTTLTVTDLSTPASSVKKINFQDLLGQPTWVSPFTIQAKLVMRSDLNVNDTIMLPKDLITTSQAAQTGLTGNPANSSAFTGNYVITNVHHYGSFRQPDGNSWNTTINAIVQPKGLGS